MNLSKLKPAAGSTHHSKRVGRGEGTRKGGTATRGHKGAQSRSGYHRKWGFEGGQMPLQRRIPKYGFKNPFRTEYVAINLDTLQRLHQEKNATELTPELFQEWGLCSKRAMIKILGRGALEAGLQVKAHAFSASAKSAIEQAGGSAETI